ncbi:hypothetical protein HDE_08281 [Halotydeus destructor]|nr:hypothetical protein HDE_08281 [Halotydeus destructor]
MDCEKYSAEQRWHHARTNGQKEHGVADNDTENLPGWFDKQRFLAAQEHLKKHRTSISFSHLCGLMFVVQLPHGLAPLLYTKKSGSVCSLFTRYIDTIIHVKRWYDSDLFDPSTEGYKSIRQVRSMHKHVASVMNAMPSNNNNGQNTESSDGRVWVSQFDMMVTQWAFIGLVLQHPEKCGLHRATQEDFAAIIYVWRVISYLIGIKDEYSMCLDSVEDTIKLSSLVYQEVYHPVLSAEVPPAPQGYEMARDIIKSLKPLLGNLQSEIFLKHWYEHLGVRQLVPLTSWWNVVTYYSMQFHMNVVYYYFTSFYRWHGSRLQAKALKAHQSSDSIVKRMTDIDKVVKYVYYDL